MWRTGSPNGPLRSPTKRSGNGVNDSVRPTRDGLRRRRRRMGDTWHLDELFVAIQGRALDGDRAYRCGLFPMEATQLPGVLPWWSPDPRGILPSCPHGHSALSCASSRHSGGKELATGSARDPGYGSAHLLVPMGGHRFFRLAARRTARGSPWSERRSALHGHAAAATDGHVSHDGDRLASTRLRRAAAARDVRSAGTVSVANCPSCRSHA